MARYRINMTQDVLARVDVSFEIESDRPFEELKAEYEELAENITRLGRFWDIEEELEHPEEYIDGTLDNELFYEGDDGGPVDLEIYDTSDLITDESEEDSEEDGGFL